MVCAPGTQIHGISVRPNQSQGVGICLQNVAKRRDIVAGPRTGDRISVASGLKPGERVATAGVTALEDGMKVRIQSAKK